MSKLLTVVLVSLTLSFAESSTDAFLSTDIDKVFFTDTSKKILFSEAKHYCESNDGKLWEPASKAEHDFVFQEVKRLKQHEQQYWLGIPETSSKSMNNFLSGSRIGWTYWERNEPDGRPENERG